MLGEGIVSFGVTSPDAQDCRNAKSSPKIVCARWIFEPTWIAAGVNSMSPCSLELDLDVARSLLDAAELIDEIHVPRRAAELPVGRRLQADVVLHLHDRANRL